MIKLQAADPNQKNKQKIWDSYVSPDDKFKQQDFIASTSSFYNYSDKMQSRYFGNLWFEQIEFVENNKHRDYFDVFFTQLSPAFLGSQKDLDRMKGLLQTYQSTEKSFFCRLLAEEIDKLELIIKLRN